MPDPPGSPSRLVVYGGPPSQPTRAVVWVCLLQELPFELRLFADRSRWREPDFLALNPRSQMPTIVDGEFVLYEMPAILAYLCNKHGWQDLYPRDLETRALVDQYLHFHHSTTRLATFKLMGPHVTIAFGDGPPRESSDVIMLETIYSAIGLEDTLGEGHKVVQRVGEILEASFFRAESPFLCGTPTPTIADIACYEELAQLQWAKLFAFDGFARISAWLDAMRELPAHDAVHCYGFELGDIVSRPNTLERFATATEAGLEALRELGVEVTISP